MMKTSRREVMDLALAIICVSLAFAIASTQNIFSLGLAVNFVIALLTAGIGFTMHELMHKFAAQSYGAMAEFRANPLMLFFAVILSFTGFIFAAPGAVMIAGRITKRQYGIISAAGIAANIAIALAFAGLAYLMPGSPLRGLFLAGAQINALLATFNLIPFGNFDGQKVMNWSVAGYIAMVAIGILLMGLTGFFT